MDFLFNFLQQVRKEPFAKKRLTLTIWGYNISLLQRMMGRVAFCEPLREGFY